MLLEKESPTIFELPLFQSLSILEREALLSDCRESKFKKNDFVFMPRKERVYLYLLLNGVIKTGTYDEAGKEVIQSIVYPNKLFGELAVLGDNPDKEFGQVLTAEATVLEIPLNKIQEMIQANAGMALAFAKVVGLRLKKAEQRLQSMVFNNARGRIIDFIKDLAESTGRVIGYETLVYNYLTHLEIANLTATSRQTVTTVLNELKSKNLIYFDRKRILIRSLENLV